MIITNDISLYNFEAWSGGKDTLDRIISEGKCDEVEALLEELYPDGMTDTELNDILWFESDWIYESVGIRTEEQIKSELDEKREELADLMESFESDAEDMTEEEKAELFTDSYEEDINELKEEISELEEELDNI